MLLFVRKSIKQNCEFYFMLLFTQVYYSSTFHSINFQVGKVKTNPFSFMFILPSISVDNVMTEGPSYDSFQKSRHLKAMKSWDLGLKNVPFPNQASFSLRLFCSGYEMACIYWLDLFYTMKLIFKQGAKYHDSAGEDH